MLQPCRDPKQNEITVSLNGSPVRTVMKAPGGKILTFKKSYFVNQNERKFFFISPVNNNVFFVYHNLYVASY